MSDFNEHFPDMSYKSGWNPYEPFYPKDEFSKTMLSSIVTKVSKWLQNMNEDSTGTYGELQWNYTPDGGTIIYANESKDRFIQIWWDVDPLSLDTNSSVSICGSDKRFEDVTNNLEFFIAVEHAIYSELEKLQKEISDNSGSERFILKDTPPREDSDAFALDLAASQRVKVGPIQSIGLNGITYDESE